MAWPEPGSVAWPHHWPEVWRPGLRLPSSWPQPLQLSKVSNDKQTTSEPCTYVSDVQVGELLGQVRCGLAADTHSLLLTKYNYAQMKDVKIHISTITKLYRYKMYLRRWLSQVGRPRRLAEGDSTAAKFLSHTAECCAGLGLLVGGGGGLGDGAGDGGGQLEGLHSDIWGA